MTVERKLGVFTPVKNPQGDRVASSAGGVPFSGQGVMRGSNDGEVERAGGILVSAGPARTDHGNNYQGMPQANEEVRGQAQTSIGYANVSGNVQLDVSLANVFRISLGGNTTISFTAANWPKNSYERTSTAQLGIGLEWCIDLIIENPNAYTLNIFANHYGPHDVAMIGLTSKFMEFGVALNSMGGWADISRVFPAIWPSTQTAAQ